MSRVQIICIGASITYGVGGIRGGWAENHQSQDTIHPNDLAKLQPEKIINP